jgi:hypothetical protein
MESVHEHIRGSISRRKKGGLIFPADYRGKGSESSVRMALSRLSREGKLKRLAHGVYFVPKIDPLFGEIYPSAEEVAQSIARKEKIKIKPAGAYALHALGLSTQVPTRLVYITDGEDRQIKLGKLTIRFKATTPKKMAMEGPLSSLIIQALEEFDIKNVPGETEKRIRELLEKEDPGKLKKDLVLAPARIHDYILRLLKKAV